MAYVVEVVPPTAGEAAFEVVEYDYGGACLRARRYRERGYGAAVSSTADRPRWWRVRALGSALPPMGVCCRSLDCALAMARRVDPAYDAVQPVGDGEEATA